LPLPFVFDHEAITDKFACRVFCRRNDLGRELSAKLSETKAFVGACFQTMYLRNY
jgi:hypothetical protein